MPTTDPAGIVRIVRLDAGEYEISAKYIQNGNEDKTWQDIVDLVGVGLKIVVDDPNTAGTEPKTTASATTTGKLYMVQLSSTTSGTYTEFVTVEKPAGTYHWEKIGTTDADLSTYAKKGAITLTGSAASGGTTETGSAGAGSSSNTGTAGAITKTVSITDTAGAPTTTGSAGAGSSSATGSAGAETVTSTDAADHKHSVTISAHSHTVTPSSATTTIITAVGNAASNGDHNHSVTIADHSHTVSATTSSGVTGATYNSTDHAIEFTTGTIVTAVSATGVGGGVTVNTSTTGAHTHSVSSTPATLTYMVGATLGTAGSFTGNTGEAGGHNHDVTVSAHTHSYTAPGAHTHSITPTSNTWTYELSVAAHSHSYSAPAAHTHSIATHSHSVSVSGNNYGA